MKGQKDPKVSGAILTVVGFALAYWQIYLPLSAARAHAAQVDYDSKFQMLAIALIPLGLFTFFAGDKISSLNNFTGNSKDPGFWLVVGIGLVLAVVAIGFDIWLTGQLSQLGYTHKYG